MQSSSANPTVPRVVGASSTTRSDNILLEKFHGQSSVQQIAENASSTAEKNNTSTRVVPKKSLPPTPPQKTPLTKTPSHDGTSDITKSSTTSASAAQTTSTHRWNVPSDLSSRKRPPNPQNQPATAHNTHNNN